MKKIEMLTKNIVGYDVERETIFSRTEMLVGKDAVKNLGSKKVALFGLGGVGSYVLEALARVGVQNFVLIDNDIISESNINRQLLAVHSTRGLLKTECAVNRIQDINPSIKVTCFSIFYNEKTASLLDEELRTCDYIIDAIDTVSAKILLVERATAWQIPILCCMGTGNKIDPTQFEITEIEKTSVCPLARVMRRELKIRGIKKVKVLFSKEEPIKSVPPASISFVPSAAGLLIAGEVARYLLKE